MSTTINIAGAYKPYTADDAPVAESIEGYVLIMTNLHPETSEDHIFDTFEEYCRVVNLHLNMDKRTGYAKGYALIEFRDIDDAKEIMDLHNEKKIEILGRQLELDYAFVEIPNKTSMRYKSKRIESKHVRDRLENTDQRDQSPTR